MTQKIKLLKHHEHMRVQYRAGAVIEVSPSTAQWLVAQGVGVLINGKTKSEHKES